MSVMGFRLLLIPLLLGSVGGMASCRSCGDSDEPQVTEERRFKKPDAEFDRDRALGMLRLVEEAIHTGEFNHMARYLQIPVGGNADDLPRHLRDLGDSGALTRESILILEREGRFGPAAEFLGGERTRALTSGFRVQVRHCRALVGETSEVVFCPGHDGRFRIVHLTRSHGSP